MIRGTATKQDAKAATRKRAPRWQEADVRRFLAEAESSGLGMAEYARREGLDEKRLYSWRSRLAGRPASTEGSATRDARPPYAKPAFVPAVIVGHRADAHRTASARDLRGGVELVLRSGHRLHVDADFDAATLVRLVEALESSRC